MRWPARRPSESRCASGVKSQNPSPGTAGSLRIRRSGRRRICPKTPLRRSRRKRRRKRGPREAELVAPIPPADKVTSENGG